MSKSYKKNPPPPPHTHNIYIFHSITVSYDCNGCLFCMLWLDTDPALTYLSSLRRMKCSSVVVALLSNGKVHYGGFSLTQLWQCAYYYPQ